MIKNTSDHDTTITDINSVAIDHGRFNFADLTRNGPLKLAAGEEVRLKIDAERAQYWVSQGAQPSDRVAKLLKEQQQ